eukprot:6823873-Prymnesium_polylepis.1
MTNGLRAACFDVSGGELHLQNATVVNMRSMLSGDAAIFHAEGSITLVLVTFTEFKQNECDGRLFGQSGGARIVLRDVKFTPLAGCSPAGLASSTAFAGVTPLTCGTTYQDTNAQLRGVCSSTAPGACTVHT